VKRVELRQIVAEVLEVEADALASDVDLATIETFDSVSVLVLMVALDERAGVKLSPTDSMNLKLYGDIERLAERQGIVLED
jgi:acyl carrier protein